MVGLLWNSRNAETDYRHRRQVGNRQPFGRKYFLILSPSVLNRTLVPRNWRICFLVRLIMPWRLRDCANSTLPVAVILKRFLAPDLVLSLGILLSCSGRTIVSRTARSAGNRIDKVCWLSTSPQPRQPL